MHVSYLLDMFQNILVGQQFRDLLHTKYKSSTRAKAEKRKRGQGDEWELSTSCSVDDSSATYTSPQGSGAKPDAGTDTDFSPPEPPTSSLDVSKVPAKDLFDTKIHTSVASAFSNPTSQPTGRKRHPGAPKPAAGMAKAAVDAADHDSHHHQGNSSSASKNNNHDDEGGFACAPMDLDFVDLEPLPIGNGSGRDHNSFNLNLGSCLEDDGFPNFFNSCPDINSFGGSAAHGHGAASPDMTTLLSGGPHKRESSHQKHDDIDAALDEFSFQHPMNMSWWRMHHDCL